MSEPGVISVYKHTEQPTKAWAEISVKQTVNKVRQLSQIFLDWSKKYLKVICRLNDAMDIWNGQTNDWRIKSKLMAGIKSEKLF